MHIRGHSSAYYKLNEKVNKTFLHSQLRQLSKYIQDAVLKVCHTLRFDNTVYSELESIKIS